MTWRLWLRIGLTVVGVLALAVLIWFLGPLVAIADVRPLGPVSTRLLVIGLVVLAVAGMWAWDIYRRHKAREQLATAMAATAEDDDSQVLNSTMKDALETLRRTSGGRRDYLYELPWYVIIGPPGAGKTTALVNCGLKFPLAAGASPEAIAGVGGTRYCDWWFTEDAVLIDTAGRYTTQDSSPKGDQRSWLSFLELLKKNRPKQPINGVMVAISIEDLLTSTREELNLHAAAIRKRLLELHDHLKVDFPVYALFTKADLIAGFNEFFGHLNESERRMVWGTTFQTADKTRNMIGEVPREFDAVIARLTEFLPDRLQEEPGPDSRVVLFGFPTQMAALKGAVTDFLGRIFEPTRYHANATLRGFYFTSGTQQGTPIDQLLGALSRNFGAEEMPVSAYSGRGRSYFLTDLMKKVIIGEAGWVSTNRAAVRRAVILKGAAYAAIVLGFVLATGAWWVSYSRNRALIAQAEEAYLEYQTVAGPVLRETLVSNYDLTRVLPLLHRLRHMPTGYETREQGTPVPETFGLSQRERLASASGSAYQIALERLFRSRLLLRLEEQLEARRNDPGFLYEALKVYLMLGGQAPEVDRDLIVAWMRRDWAENLHPGAGNARGRQALEEHLVAMLGLDVGAEPVIALNGDLVRSTQRTLALMSVSDRAYHLLKSQATSAGQPDWTLASRGGPHVDLVFAAKGSEGLDEVRVPYFFTYDGFYRAFLEKLSEVGEQVDQERWVLGDIGKESAVSAQYASLYHDVLRLYTRDFVAAWNGMLDKLRLKPLVADKPRYMALGAASGTTSPFKTVLEAIRDETRLTRERPAQAAPTGPGVAATAGQMAMEQAARMSSTVSRVNNAAERLAAAAGRSSGGTNAGLVGEAPGAGIEAQFRPFLILVEGEVGRRPVDQLIAVLAEIHNNLTLAATNPSQTAQANAALQVQVANLRASAARFPQPFAGMLRTAAGDFENDVTGASRAQLSQALSDQVIRACTEIVTSSYPFVRTSPRDLAISDFARLFAPGGIMDKFFTQNLAPLVDMSKGQWTWRVDHPMARGLSVAALREFQRASEIRDAFFPLGGTMPSVTIGVTPMTRDADAATAKLDINGTVVAVQPGASSAASVSWPGAGIGRVAITIGGSSGFFSSTPPTLVYEKTGPWALHRTLDSTSVVNRGDGLVVSFAAGGRELSYLLTVGSVQNPLQLPALRDFRCPTGI
jgi:type VI secretion system protein ImpL